jgi:hypothetical protein
VIFGIISPLLMIWYNTIFTDCYWVSTQKQWCLNLNTKGKEQQYA